MTHGIFCCRTQALHCSAWDSGILVPQAGIEPESPASQSRFLTTEPSEKSLQSLLLLVSHHVTLPGDSVVKNLPTNAGDSGLIPGLGRFPWRKRWQPPPPTSPHLQMRKRKGSWRGSNCPKVTLLISDGTRIQTDFCWTQEALLSILTLLSVFTRPRSSADSAWVQGEGEVPHGC